MVRFIEENRSLKNSVELRGIQPMSQESILSSNHGYARRIVGFTRGLSMALIVLIASFGPIARANTAQTMNEQENHVQIVATTDFTQMHAGESGFLAINLTTDEDWHTYWPGISDSGYGISFTFETPDSITFGKPIWPTPKRYLQPGNILDHTYEGTVTVLYPFTISDDAKPNDVIVISIDANYLVCKEVCLPEKGRATCSITLVDSSTQSKQSDDAPRINQLLAARPLRFDPTASDVRLQWISNAAAIMFRDATKIEFYPDQDCTEITDLIKDGASPTNRMEIRFTQSNDKVLSGRLRVFDSSGFVDYDIHVKPERTDKSNPSSKSKTD